MRKQLINRIFISLCAAIILGLWIVPESHARGGGSVAVYYGTTTSYTPAVKSRRSYTKPVVSADGLGGGSPAVKIGTTNMSNCGSSAVDSCSSASIYSVSSDTNSVAVEVKPDATHKIGSIRLIKWVQDTDDSVTTVDIDLPATGTTTFTIDLKNRVKYILLVDYDNSSNFTLSYTVVSDVAASPATTCKSTANYIVKKDSSTGSALAASTNVTASSGNTGLTFFIDNSLASCQVDAIQFNSGSWDPAAWNASTKLYTTPPIDANSTFQIRYKGLSYTVTTAIDASGSTTCGSISPGTSIYGSGTSPIFTVLKNPGCAIESFKDNGVAASLSSSNTYTIPTIAANHTLTVKFVAVSVGSATRYCQVPPFMDGQSTLMPNVLVIFDNSGSMGGNPYNNQNYTCVAGDLLENCSNFYGYFDNTKMYKKHATIKNQYEIDTSYSPYTSTPLNLAKKGLSGNYLNSTLMAKVDILRKILIGGKVYTGTGYADRTSTIGGSNNRYLVTDGNTRIQYGTDNPKGLLDKVKDQVRLGMMVFNQNSNSGELDEDGGVLISPIGTISADADLAALVANIESDLTSPGGSTPLAETYYEALRYFQGGTSAYNTYDASGGTISTTLNSKLVKYNGTATDALNPHRVYAKPILGSCQNNFILLITDGAPTNDTIVPTNSTSISDSALTTWWNTVKTTTPIPPQVGTGADADDNLLARLTYYARNYDFNANAATWGQPADMRARQSITTFTVFSFGDDLGEEYLQQAAKFGAYNEDKNVVYSTSSTVANRKNGKPDIDVEYLTKTTDAASFKGYFKADNGDLLAGQLSDIFNEIVTTSASGTAAAVANNKSGQRGANMIQAMFYPKFPTADPQWLGEVQALWYYLDPMINYSSIFQDSDSNAQLNLKLDKLLPSDPFDTLALWRAGAMLHKKAAGDRKIYTLLTSTESTPAARIDLTSGTTNSFVVDNKTTLKPLLNASELNDTSPSNQTSTLINYLRGIDSTGYRSRALDYTYIRAEGGTKTSTNTLGDIVKNTTSTATTDGVGVWKLGDIINSTPVVQSSVPINAYNNAYSDYSYSKFIETVAYKGDATNLGRNMVYTGSNDGMLHAFKLGKTSSMVDSANPFLVAKMEGADLGNEEWAFIPHNALPYMRNQCDGNYCHQYLVDGAPTVVDAAINIPTGCTSSNYWECERKPTYPDSVTDENSTSWRTVLVSSMGLGGASRDKDSNCNETFSPDGDATNNNECVKTPVAGNGLSSYFALDVTNPAVPKFMWEFSDYSISNAAHKGLGFTTPGAAIVRINAPAKTHNTNGKWFAVMASGPTGGIDSSHRWFSGHSDQNLKIYIVDLNAKSTFIECTGADQTPAGCNFWVKDTGIPFAFANSLSGSAIDLDRWDITKDGNFSDSVVYITYTKATLTNNANCPTNATLASGYTAKDCPTNSTSWNRGGIMRLVTNHNPDPFKWFTSPLIGERATDTIGPITTSVARVQDRNNKKLWIYFGEGRYFFPEDERTVGRNIYGVIDPCYNQYLNTSNTPSPALYTGDTYLNYALGTSDTSTVCPSVDVSTLKDQSSSPSDALTSSQKGWYINLSASGETSTAGAERVVSDVTASFNGLVFYTTYTPNTDICTPGGVTSLWAVRYDSGGTPPKSSLQGKAPIQTSSGGIKMIDMATSFTQKDYRKLGASFAPSGMAPKGKFPPLLSPKPSRQIMQILEK